MIPHLGSATVDTRDAMGDARRRQRVRGARRHAPADAAEPRRARRLTGVPARSAAARARGGPRPMPPELRRDVRLLTTLLGEAIAESGGPELLDDGRGAPRAARSTCGGRTTGTRGGGSSSSSASLDAGARRAGDPGVHLLLPAREPGGGAPADPGAAGPDARRRPARGLVRRRSGAARRRRTRSARMRIHPVLTAHPTEAKRRAVVENLWRIGDAARARSTTSGARRAERRRGQAAAGRGDRRALAHRPGAHHRARRRSTRCGPRSPCSTTRSSRRCPSSTARSIAASTPRAPALRPSPRSRVPPVGHVGRRRPRRQPGGHGRDHAKAAAIAGRPRAARPRGRDPAHRAEPHRLSDATCRHRRRSAGACVRDERAVPGAASELRGRCPTRRTAGSSCSRPTAWPPRARIAEARYDDAVGVPARPRRDRRLARRRRRAGASRGASSSTCAGRPRRSGSTSPRWRCASTRRSSTRRCASSRRDAAGNARALDRLARAQGGRPRRGEDRRRRREVLATFRAIRDIQDRLGAPACERVIVSFTRSRRRPRGRACPGAARRASTRRPIVQPVPLLESRHELATATDILDAWIALPGTKRLAASGGGRELQVMVGYSDSAKEVGVLAANLQLYRAQRAMAAWAARARPASSRSSTGAAARSAAAAARPAARSSASRRGRSTAGSRSPSRARWRSRATATRCSRSGTSSSSRARWCGSTRGRRRARPGRPVRRRGRA